MKTYRVMASYVEYCEVTIEAENEEDAWAQAKDLNVGSFDLEGHGDWTIDEIFELQGETE
jgi:hypothetical protein